MTSSKPSEISAFLTELSEDLHDGVFLVDSTGSIRYANSAAEKMFRYSGDELAGMQVDDLMPESARSYHAAVRTEYFDNPFPREFSSGRTFDCVDASGRTFPADIVLNPVEHNGVTLVRIVVRSLFGAVRAENQSGVTSLLDSVTEVGNVVHSSLSIDRSLELARKQIKNLVDYERLCVVAPGPEFDAPGLNVLGGDGISDESGVCEVAREVITDRIATRRNISGEPISSADPQSDNLAGIYSSSETEESNLMIVPIFLSGELIGFMIFERTDGGVYTETQLSLATRIAQQFAGVVAHTIEVQKIREDSRVELLLSQIGRTPIVDQESGRSSPELGGRIRQIVDCDSVSITCLTEDRSSFRIVYKDFGSLEYLADWDVGTIHPVEGTAGATVLEADSAVLLNTESWSAFKELYPGAGPDSDGAMPKALMNVPLKASGETFGFLTVRSAGKGDYSESDLELLSRIGEQLSASVALSELHRRDEILLHERSVMTEMGSLLGGAKTLDDVWEDFSSLLTKLIQFNHVALCAIDVEAQRVRILNDLWKDESRTFGRRPGDSFDLAGSVSEDLVKTRKSGSYFFPDRSEWRENTRVPGTTRTRFQFCPRSEFP